MDIKIATQGDLPAIVEIYNQAVIAGEKTADLTTFSVNQRIEWFHQHTPEKYPIYVAVKDEVITGYLSFSAYREGREAFAHTAEVSYYIDKNYRGKSIGSELLQHAIQCCPALDIKNLIAMLIEGNQESIGLLEKFGFEQWGHLPNIAEFNGDETGHLYLRSNDYPELLFKYFLLNPQDIVPT